MGKLHCIIIPLLCPLKVVRYSFPQFEAIHTQIALKMKNEYDCIGQIL